MDKDRVFKIVTNYMAYLVHEKKLDIKKAYLFGSYAKGNANENSDIDIAIVFPDNCNTFETMVQLMLLARDFSLDIEPHAIRAEDFSLSNPIAYEIMKTGIPIY